VSVARTQDPALAPVGAPARIAGDRRPVTASLARMLRRLTAAVSEQGLFAGSNFLLNLTMAATLPAVEYGAFVFAFTIFTIVAGLHNAVILEPATVLRTTLYDTQAGSYCRAQLILHAAVMALFGGALAVVGAGLLMSGASPAVGRALLAAGFASPLILLYWLGRRFTYVLQRPATALAGAIIYFGTLTTATLALRAMDKLSAPAGFVILAAAGAGAALFLMTRAGVFRSSEAGTDERLSLRELAVERWAYGRWLIGAVCIESAIVPGLTLATTLLLGLGAVGVLRAMQVFAVPAGHIVAAVSALLLPSLSRDYQHGRLGSLRDKTSRLIATVVACAVLVEVALALFHTPLERFVYGQKFAEYAFLIPIVGAATLLDGTSATYTMLLSAVQRPRRYLASVALTVPVTLIGGVVCISLWGITGAAITLVLTSAASLAIRRRLAAQWLRGSVASISEGQPCR
jgi:O-antigen/teichoic acid export membrane protein